MTAGSTIHLKIKPVFSSIDFLKIIDELEDGFFETDLTGTFCFVNKAMSEIFGFSEQELIGMNNRAYMLPEEAKALFLKFNTVFITGIPAKGIEYQIIKKDKTKAIVDVSVSLIKNESDDAIGFRGTMRDITARKEMEYQLKTSEMRYRSILEDINELYFETDLVGVLTFFNLALERLLEYPAAEILGSSYKRFMDDKNSRKYVEASRMVRDTGQSAPVDLELRPKSGKRLLVESRLFAVLSANGKTVGYRGVARDITARKRTEEELIRYQNQLEEMVEQRTEELLTAKKAAEKANQAKSEFLANISHELRTPLHGILSFSKFGMEKIDSSQKSNNLHYFERINQAGNRLLFLVNDLLDLAMLESGKFEYVMSPFELEAITLFVVQAFETQAVEKGLKIIVQPATFSTQVLCDSNKMTQVIRNLMSNAIRYSLQNSTITIQFEQVSPEGGEAGEKLLKFSISDQGVGIPEAELELIFEKFKQSSRTDTGAGGTGLGLSICREIIRLHKGKIWAENNATGGAKFSFTLSQP